MIHLALALGCERAPPHPPEAAHDVANDDWYSESRELYFGIPVSVRFAPADPELAREVWAYLVGVDDVFNDFRDDSEIGRLNAKDVRQGVRVSDDLADALRLSKKLHELTGGAFDVSVGPLRRLWREAERKGAEPSPAEITRARASCGLDKVKLNGNALSLDAPGMALDFGGIVKGMAVDRAISMLKAGDARAALVQVGGETACFGISRRGMPHVVGVRDPVTIGRLRCALKDPGAGLSVATSGNYFNPIELGGRKLYHIFDPRTGRPVSTSVLSVTVAFPVTGKNGLADGLSTAGAVLGPDALFPIVERLGGEAMSLSDDANAGRERATRGWHTLVR